MKTIAAQCGYPNQLYFSQAFKKCYDLSPQEWRQLLSYEIFFS
ncbi:AraC family transcriptional regulator [Lachnospiraceae bacterium 29-91]|nr:AraC family transcriptional regulator [uncultured Schaedlerella sp.]